MTWLVEDQIRQKDIGKSNEIKDEVMIKLGWLGNASKIERLWCHIVLLYP